MILAALHAVASSYVLQFALLAGAVAIAAWIFIRRVQRQAQEGCFRLDDRERHVVGHYRLGEAPEGERAKLFGCDAAL